MIYITGDIHGDAQSRLSMAAFPEQKEMTKEDYVIICGDFGLIWNWQEEDGAERYNLNWLEDKNFTTLFVDGNHECFPRLYQCPEKEFCGGRVHELRPSVLHLKRGEYYDIHGTTIFAFGGARSHDIDVLLDPQDSQYPKKKKWYDSQNIFYRQVGRSWWEEEMPTRQEMSYGFANLEKHDWKVDYIVSHECPESTLHLMYAWAAADELNAFFDDIRAETDYKRWFFGHYHEDRTVNNKEICLYEQIIRIA